MQRALASGAKRFLLKSLPPRQLLKVIREVGVG
jgi:DNA-binding NarL/FixJ family response regulator